jgi:hypothetical protein
MLRSALLVLILLAAPAHAQTPVDPVRVADLIGLPILDGDKVEMGRVRGVARTGAGKIQLLLPLGGLFGFGERLVPIPIENVALGAGAVSVLDVPRDRFQQARTWYGHDSELLAATDTISVNKR